MLDNSIHHEAELSKPKFVVIKEFLEYLVFHTPFIIVLTGVSLFSYSILNAEVDNTEYERVKKMQDETPLLSDTIHEALSDNKITYYELKQIQRKFNKLNAQAIKTKLSQ